VIGGGLSGLTTIKQLTDRGIDVVCYEIGSGIGGNWRYNNDNGRSVAYASLHIDTSKERFAFGDLAAPEAWPAYLHHSQVLEYLETYTATFHLKRVIRFSHEVKSVRRDGEAWKVEVVDTESGRSSTERFRAVVVASGHHWDPAMPNFDGSFDGRVMHARQYKVPEPFADAHVIVVGLGNTGADIASELTSHAASVTLSTRSGAHILPRYVMGRPLDTLSNRTASRLPLSVQRLAYKPILALGGQSQTSSGIPRPDAPLLSQHPTVSQDLIGLAKLGKIHIAGDIARLDGDAVGFSDGSTVNADVIIYATGYNISFPFLDRSIVGVLDNEVDLYEMVVPVDVPGLYFVGLIQPVGALPPLAEQQARWVAQLIDGAMLPTPEQMTREIAEQRSRRQKQYLDRPRHTIQVDYWPYLDHMTSLCDTNDQSVSRG
jgi:cation diffusion facilitator CzcD-associated flavoprotein CzcO